MDKLLIHSNAPFVATGYGNQTALFAPRLKEHYEVAVSAFHGLTGNMIPWNGIPILPALERDFGSKSAPMHAKAFFGDLRGGIVLTLMDLWALDPEAWKKMNAAGWCPVDHDPPPPKVTRFFRESGTVPIAMSRFGQERLENALYVPHAVDTTVFKPVKDAREKTGLPKDAFIVGMVAANKGNPSRKNFPQALQAFKAFHERHDDAVIYLHTEITGWFNGVNLPRLLEELRLQDCHIFPDQYRLLFLPPPPEKMAAVFSSLDILLNPSSGEGFGLAPLEAAACGVPSIVTNFSAMPEVAKVGWHLNYKPVWVGMDELAGPSWMADPDIEDMVESLEEAYSMPTAQRKKEAAQAREHALTYDIETVMAEHMLPALEEVKQRFEDRKPVAVAA